MTSTAVPFPAASTSAVLAALDKEDTTKSNGKGRKRTITLVDGNEVDLTSTVPATPQVIEAMRLRIIQLEDQLEQQQSAAVQPPPAKRARKNTVKSAAADDDNDAYEEPTASGSSIVAPPTAAATKAAEKAAEKHTKAEEKKRKLQLKKIFDTLKKECKSDTCKFQGSIKSVKVEEMLEATDFEALFSGKGTLIQPTPQNKPKSVVTIIHFTNVQQIAALFGDELKPLKGNRWTRGGIPQRTFGFGFGGGGGLSKSVKQGAVDVTIRTIDVNYSKNNMKCTMKFEVGEGSGGGGRGGYHGDDSDY